MTARSAPARAGYPPRPPVFALKFARLLLKCCAANTLGPDGVLLLVCIAATEDARRYRGPVSFHNGQLLPLVGLGCEDTLARVRQRLVAAGWLHYEPGRRNVAPRYWVTIPDEHADWDDAPTDDRPADYTACDPHPCGPPASHAGMTRTGAEGPAVGVRPASGQSAEPSAPSLFQNEDPPTPRRAGEVAFQSATATRGTPNPRRRRGRGFEEPPGFDDFWATYPRCVRKSDRKGAAVAFTVINPDLALQARMLAAVKRYVASHDWVKEGGKYIPAPKSWLTKRRWEDEWLDAPEVDPAVALDPAEMARRTAARLEQLDRPAPPAPWAQAGPTDAQGDDHVDG